MEFVNHLKNELERLDSFLRDERPHCLAMTAKSFTLLGKSLGEFLRTQAKAKLTSDELTDLMRGFKVMTLALLSSLMDKIQDHQSFLKIDGTPIFCNCRSN